MPSSTITPPSPILGNPSTPPEQILASPLARLAALVLDGFTAAVCVVATVAAFGSELAGSLAWSAAYFYLMVEHGQTPGKSLVGIQIVGGSGRPIGFLRGGVLRNLVVPAAMIGLILLGMTVAGIPPERLEQTDGRLEGLLTALFLLAYLPILGKRRRGLHDWLTNTRVVRTA